MTESKVFYSSQLLLIYYWVTMSAIEKLKVKKRNQIEKIDYDVQGTVIKSNQRRRKNPSSPSPHESASDIRARTRSDTTTPTSLLSFFVLCPCDCGDTGHQAVFDKYSGFNRAQCGLLSTSSCCCACPSWYWHKRTRAETRTARRVFRGASRRCVGYLANCAMR